MITVGEEELVCDLAETYHVLDMWALPIKTVATLAVGLREDSRIWMKVAGMNYKADFIVKAAILDGVRTLVWQNSKDGTKGRNQPKPIIEEMEKRKAKDNIVSFSTPEDFKRAWNGD